MDLKHDWKALNEVLFLQSTPNSAASSVVLVEDNDKSIDGAVSNGRAFRDIGIEGIASKIERQPLGGVDRSSIKEMLDQISERYNTQQVIVLPKHVLDQCVIEAATLGTNYFQQLQTVRERVLEQIEKPRGRSKGALIVSRRHFVLDLFSGWIRRLLPRRFNVLLFVDQRPTAYAQGQSTGAPFSYRAILLSYSSGQLDQFFEPDFSSLHENRLMDWQNQYEAVGQYLESRYIQPCYAIFMYKDDWQKCLEIALQAANGKPSYKPWRQFVRYFDERRSTVYPNNFMTQALLATQRIMVYFGRP